MKHKVVIWGYHHQSDIDAIKSLEDAKIIEVTKWFGNHKLLNHNLNKLIHNPYLIIEKNSLVVPQELDEPLRQYFNAFTEGYSRISFSRTKNTQELWHLFYLYAHYFYALLHKSTDVVFFQNLPHHGVDIILYAVAKTLNIRTILTTQSLYENRFWYMEKISDFGIFKEIPSHENLSLTIEKTFDKDLFYMKDIKTKKNVCIASLFTDLLKVQTRKNKKPISLAAVFQKYKECKSYKFFKAKLHVKEVDFNKKYVYFPLQLQPELTTSVLGKKYVDQLLAIEHLSTLIPDDWAIYVKENPMQTFRQRDEFFYRRLKKIKNAHYLPIKYNTHYLIKQSQFVAVVTGTAGWEAISGGKNVLVFGQAWYQSLSGVFSYSKTFLLDDILNYKINHKKLESQYSSLMGKTFKGIMDPDYIRMFPNYNQEKNTQYLKDFLLKILK